MTNAVYSWNVKLGDVRQIGSLAFSCDDLASMQNRGVDAIRALSNKVLNSEKGRVIATEAYKQGGEKHLSYSVAFTEDEGLVLCVDKKPYQILTAKEVLEGKGSYLHEIQQISAAAEQQGIGTRVAEVSPSREARIRKVFEKTASVRVEQAKTSLVGRVKSACLDLMGFFTNAVSIIRNSTTAALPAAIQSIGAMRIAGGALIAIVGIYFIVVSLAELVVAVTQGSQEKKCLVLADLLVGISALGFGISYMMAAGADFAKNIAVAASAGALLPFTLFSLYICGFATSVYKTVVIWKFRRQLHSILEQKGVAQSEKLLRAMRWIRQQTHLSHLEESEQSAKASLEGDNPFLRMSCALRRKWDAFALRAGGEAHALVAELWNEDSSNHLLARLQEGDLKAVAAAKELIRRVSSKSSEQMFWGIVGAIYNVLGAVGTVVYLTVAGPAGSLASSIIFAVAAFLSLFLDVEYIRKLVVSVKDNFSFLIAAVVQTFLIYIRREMSWDEAIVLVVENFRKLKNKKCLESEKRVQQEECLRSETSLTTSDPSEALPRTQSMLTSEISPFFLDS